MTSYQPHTPVLMFNLSKKPLAVPLPLNLGSFIPAADLQSNFQRSPKIYLWSMTPEFQGERTQGTMVSLPEAELRLLSISGPPRAPGSLALQLTGPAKPARPWQRQWAPLPKSGTRWGACGTCSHRRLDSFAGYLCNSANCGKMLAISEPSSSYYRFQGHNSVGNKIKGKSLKLSAMSELSNDWVAGVTYPMPTKSCPLHSPSHKLAFTLLFPQPPPASRVFTLPKRFPFLPLRAWIRASAPSRTLLENLF